MKLRPQHLLSISRVLLGAIAYMALVEARRSWIVLPVVLCACVSDYFDGRLARRSSQESEMGRLVDNLCDAAFLALAFAGFARASTWSDPLTGSAVRYWAYANWLPLIGLALSFGVYLTLWTAALVRGVRPVRSIRGHHAGVLNYALVIVGGVAALPGMPVTPWLVEPLFVSVALFNVTAAIDSLGLLVRSAP